MNAQNKCLYEFGSFRLDPAEHILLHDGEIVPLPPKAFDTLQILVEKHGHLVEKEELLEELWADTFVEEANVSKNISILRKALSGSGLKEPFIDTIPKRGYRFIAPLTEIDFESQQDVVFDGSNGQSGSGLEVAPSRSIISRAVIQARSHKVTALLIFGALIIGTTAAAYYFVFSGKPAILTDKDVILLTDFENKTGEKIFDGTLKQGLMMQFQQSPFLSIFPEGQVRRTLKQMKRSPDEPVTREIGIEICQRQGLKALIAGSIVRFDRIYLVTLEAVNSQTGETIAITRVEAHGKDQVLSSLSKAATEMREKLGESLALIEKYDKPLPEATTASLEALKAFSMGRTLRFSAKPDEAIALYKRAVEIDPDFVFAYLALGAVYRETSKKGLAIDATIKGYELLEKASERDRFILEYVYSWLILGDLDKVIASLESAKQMYPRDMSMWGSLTSYYNTAGQYEKAAAEARDVIQTKPENVVANGNLARAYTRLNHFDKAKDVLKRIRQLGYDHVNWHNDILYPIAFAQGDQKAMLRELDWFKGRPDEFRALELQAETAKYRGQWKRSREMSEQGIYLAVKKGVKGAVATLIAVQATRAAELKRCRQAKISANKAFTFEGKPSTDHYVVSMTAYTLAKCGEISRSQTLIDELARKRPKDTLLNGIWIPVMKAEIELNKGDAKEAIKILETTKQYEHSETAYFAPQYTRGRAFLRLNENEKARIEFQKILDHRGEAPLSVRYPLAQLGLARATKDKREYEKFFEMWKDADPDLSILIEAKKEFRELNRASNSAG